MGRKIKERMGEPSTWAGLAILAAGAGKLVAPEWSIYFDTFAMIFGGGAVVKAERKF